MQKLHFNSDPPKLHQQKANKDLQLHNKIKCLYVILSCYLWRQGGRSMGKHYLFISIKTKIKQKNHS